MAAPVPDAASPAPAPAVPSTAATGPSVIVSGEAVTAALLADVEHARKPPRPAVWQSLSTERARVMLEAAAPFIRAGDAARLAEVRQAVTTFRSHYAGTLDDQAADVICAVLQVLDRVPLEGQPAPEEPSP